MRKTPSVFWVLFGLVLFLNGCGSSSSSEDGASLTASLKLANNSTNLSGSYPILHHSLGRLAASFAENSASGIESLKYFIGSIQICESLTATGSGFSGTMGCVSLITNPSDSAFSYDASGNYSNLAAVARENDSKFTDLMDTTARANLTKKVTLTSSEVRSYNWGVITWAPVIKLKASIDVGATTYRTIDGTAAYSGGYQTTASSAFTAASTASEGVMLLGNGGNYFKFQSPFTVTAADVEAKTAFSVDLTFNPLGLAKVFPSAVGSSGSGGGGLLVDSAGNSFAIPMLSLTPVFRKSADKTMKETYTAPVSGTDGDGTTNFDLRVELYYNSGDAAKTLVGANGTTQVNANSTKVFGDFPKFVYVTTNSDSSLTFKGYMEGAVLSNFTRKSAAGETTTATITCGTEEGFGFSGCGSGSGKTPTKSVTFTLQSISQLSD